MLLKGFLAPSDGWFPAESGFFEEAIVLNFLAIELAGWESLAFDRFGHAVCGAGTGGADAGHDGFFSSGPFDFLTDLQVFIDDTNIALIFATRPDQREGKVADEY